MIRTVLLGVCNSTSALVQGLEYYKTNNSKPGLWHNLVGKYGVSDIELVGAYDINKNKINSDVSEAIFTSPNQLEEYVKLKNCGIVVEKGILEEDVNTNLKSSIDISTNSTEAFKKSLLEKKPDVILNLISSGLDATSKKYAEIAFEVNSNFLNATPTNIANDEKIINDFKNKNLILVGDDLMSQFGGTAFHKGIMNLINERGIRVNKSYQLDVGGGLETNNTLDENLRAIKRKVKSSTIESELPYDVQTVSGTTDYVDFMGNSRTNYFWIEGDSFLGSKITFDIYLRSKDGPNAGGLLLDLIRGIQYSRDLNESGNIKELSNFGFKSTLFDNKLRNSYKEFFNKYIVN